VIVDWMRDTAERHPLAVDTGLAVLLAAVNLPAAQPDTAAGWTGFTAVHLPLVWRRQAPEWVFVAVLTVALTLWAAARIDAAYPMVALLAALYAVARYRRWQLWPALATVEVVLVVAWQQGDLALRDLVALSAILAATGLLGLTIRTRRAYLDALEERARRLEQDRDQRARLAAATERTRIAREMHDIVAHNLAVMVALADGAALTATAAPHRAADTLVTLASTGRQALDEMQRLLGVLHDGDQPLATAPQPGLDSLDHLIDQVRGAGLRVTLERDGTPGRWDPGAGLTVYRIVQEALTNTLKHAGPEATARVRLSLTATTADVEVTDDGAAAPRRSRSGGHGLAGMAERAAAYGGRVDAGPLPAGGWRLHASLTFGEPR
jgi:signal transduction histidine kinase